MPAAKYEDISTIDLETQQLGDQESGIDFWGLDGLNLLLCLSLSLTYFRMTWLALDASGPLSHTRLQKSLLRCQ